ncbi:MAG: TRAP transporter large permease [Clostridia bacterium]|nr:TRAP transporter large permease [Clostridia bacterium]
MIAILFGTLIVMLLIGVPIAICLLIAVSFTMLSMGNVDLFPAIAQRMFTQADNFTLMAIPFFILAGELMGKGGISKRLISFMQLCIRNVPASLAGITTVSSAFFGAISGSNPATVAAIGGITVPRMIEKGYDKGTAAAVAAASGTLGVVIPPSIPMVTYAIVASVSVGTMFLAGIVPGILLALTVCIVNIFVCGKYDNEKTTKKVTSKEFLQIFLDASFALMMPVIILGGIYSGFFTPTEAATVSCVYALVVSMFIYKELKVSDLPAIFVKSAISSGVILFVVSCSAPFGWLMTSEGIPSIIANTILNVFTNKFAILFAMNLVLLFFGCLLETQAIILLMSPILLPIAASLGLSPIALGIIMIINTSIGMITPPMAVNLFVAGGIARVSLEEVSKKVVPFFIAEVILLLILTYFPDVITFLPNLMQ